MRSYLKHQINTENIVIILIMLVVGIILSMIFVSKIKGFKRKYRGKFFIWLSIALLSFALVPFLGNNRTFGGIFSEFLFYQCCSMILGTIHIVVFYYYFKKFEQESVWMQILFNIIIGIFSMIPFTLVYTLFNGNAYLYMMYASIINFIIPTWVYAVFYKGVSIPAKVYKRWFYPVDNPYPEPKEDEMKDLIVLSFVFNKTIDDPIRVSFRSKAPVRMDFGRLFMHFIDDYNDRHPDNAIDFVDEDNNPYGWVFYLKPKWYGVSKYIETDLPIYMNGITENSVIICKRVAYDEEGEELERERVEEEREMELVTEHDEI